MSRALDDLSPRFRPLAVEFLARLVEAQCAVMIIDTLRTPAEQEANLRRGVSWTKHSKHLTGDAMDVCPYRIWDSRGQDKLSWDASDPLWQKIGEIAESCGLKWGGRWTQRDLGHVEWPT